MTGTTIAGPWPLVVFFMLAVSLSWLAWIPLALATRRLITWRVAQELHLIGSLGPIFATLIVSWLIGSGEALREIGARMVKWRIAPQWHAIAWLGPFLLLGIAAVHGHCIHHAIGRTNRYGGGRAGDYLGAERSSR